MLGNASFVKEPYRTLARAIGLSCAILFMAFTFTLVYCVKGELLAYAQHVYSAGVTHYNLLIGAIIITLVLQALQMVIAWLLPLPLRVHALTYLPSCLGLVMLTNITPEVIAHFHFGLWTWIAPLLLILYVLVAILARHLCKPVRHVHDASLFFVSNYGILLVLLALSACIDLTRDTFLMELKQERLIVEHRYEEAARVGETCLDPTQRMLCLRAFALAQTDDLAECLFDMPQLHGSDGLLCVEDTCRRLRRFDTQNICRTLGAYCGTVSSTDSYLRLLLEHLGVQQDSLLQVDTAYIASSDSVRLVHEKFTARNLHQQRLALEYYTLSQLLSRQLDSLPALLDRRAQLRGDTTHIDPLPRAYAEAICLIDTLKADTATLARLHNYQQMCDTISHPIARRNLSRRKFGNTYWWYYDFGF